MNANFWIRLKSFIERVEVNDQPGEEEKQMILSICKGWEKFIKSQQIDLNHEKTIYANQKLVEFVSWLNDKDDVDSFIPNSWIGQFNLSQNETSSETKD